MSHQKAVCAECRQKVMASDGRAINHFVRGTTIRCDGSDEVVLELETAPAPPVRATAESPPPPPPAPAPKKEVPAASPSILDEQIEAARQRAAQNTAGGSLDLEALRHCGCPSLEEAIARYLGAKKTQ